MSDQRHNVSTISSGSSRLDAQPCRSSQIESFLQSPTTTETLTTRPQARTCATRFVLVLVTFFVVNFLVLFLFNDNNDRPFLNLLIGFTVLSVIVILIFTMAEIRNFYHQNGILFWGGDGNNQDDVTRLVDRRQTGSREQAEAIDSTGRGVSSGRLVSGEDSPPEYEAPPDYQQLCVLGLIEPEQNPEIIRSDINNAKADIP